MEGRGALLTYYANHNYSRFDLKGCQSYPSAARQWKLVKGRPSSLSPPLRSITYYMTACTGHRQCAQQEEENARGLCPIHIYI